MIGKDKGEHETENMPGSPVSPDVSGVVGAVDEAKASGKLKPLEDLMLDMGWDEDPSSLMLLAQKDDRTQGKSPQELADMMREEPGIYDDLIEWKPGGVLDTRLGKTDETTEEEGETPSDEEADEAMASAPSVGNDKEKAKKALKSSGFKPKTKAPEDYESKKNFMLGMSEQ